MLSLSLAYPMQLVKLKCVGIVKVQIHEQLPGILILYVLGTVRKLICIANFTCTKCFHQMLTSVPTCFGTSQVPSSGSPLSSHH